jgi:hypothetical protein
MQILQLMGKAQLEAFPSASIVMEIWPEFLAPEGEENLLRNHLPLDATVTTTSPAQGDFASECSRDSASGFITVLSTITVDQRS